jgi:hypothetical protein
LHLPAYTLCSLRFAPLVMAQQPTKVPRVGYLIAAPLSASANRTEAFRQGLSDLGYLEGKNIIIEWRSAEEIANVSMYLPTS